MVELGKALTQARIARGLSLHDVERDTRISLRYIKALENEEFEEMPAPVYARAFLRTYAQYLGLSAPAMVQHLPGARPEPELPPLPEVSRPTAPALSASWIVAALVVVGLFGGGLLFFSQRGGGEPSVTSEQPALSEGAEQSGPPDGEQPVAPVLQPGLVPSLQGQPVETARDTLRQLQYRYLTIELDSDEPEGTVFGQSPSPGSEAPPQSTVTLMVSR